MSDCQNTVGGACLGVGLFVALFHPVMVTQNVIIIPKIIPYFYPAAYITLIVMGSLILGNVVNASKVC